MSIKNHVSYLFSLTQILFVTVGLMASLLVSPTVEAQTPPSEPDCQQVATAPTFNPYPLVTNLPNPSVTNGNCRDMPLLSFFPIDTANNNPRTTSIIANQEVQIHIYYNNGAIPTAGPIVNPTLGVSATKISETQFRLSATLSSSNAGNVTSAQRGGDLIVNVPSGTNMCIVGQKTGHYPDAIERQFQATQDGRLPFDRIPDNSVGSLVSNPIYTNITGLNLPSSAGFRLKDSLEAGFLGYGYVVGALIACEAPRQVNTPPQCPGQEITIIRGQTGSFNPLNCTDPEEDYPLVFNPRDLPSFCVFNNQTLIVTCTTNDQTAARSVYTVTPTDSRGLVGTPGTFIVNVIEPGLNITKTCIIASRADGTVDGSTRCSDSILSAGDVILYTLQVANSGNAPAVNVVVVDDYDGLRLQNIANITPNGQLNTTDSTITWNYPRINANASETMTFNATVANNVQNGDIVVNTGTVRADNIPPKTVRVEFPVGVAQPIVSTSTKSCLKKNTTIECKDANLKPGDEIVYSINVRNTGNKEATNVRVVDSYDGTKLTNIKNASQSGVIDTSKNTVTWELGTLQVGQVTVLTFEANVAASVVNGTQVVNTALITSPDFPDQTVRYDFPIVIIPQTNTVTTGGGTLFLVLILGLMGTGAGVYFYRKNHKLTKAFVPSRSTEIEVEKVD